MKQRLRSLETLATRKFVLLLAFVCISQVRSAAASALPSLTPLGPDYVRSLKSQTSNTQTTINFVNRTDDPVDVYWVNFHGGLVFYQHLTPTQSAVIQTYVTHPWLIYDDRTAAYIVGFLPIGTAAQAVIKTPDVGSSAAKTNRSTASDSTSATGNAGTAISAPALASFDCAKASSPAEKRICSDPLLAKMDHEMGTRYRNLIQNSKNAKAWESDQRAWLVKRNRCKSDDGCLRSTYLERLVILSAPPPSAQWGANWSRVYVTGQPPSPPPWVFNGASVEIKQVTAQGFDFHMTALEGAHVGELEGKAMFASANKAHWHNTDKDLVGNCSGDFERVLNRLEVREHSDSCDANGDFEGTYVAVGPNQDFPTPDLVSLGVVATPEQDDALRKLLGKDYDAMALTADEVNTDEEGEPNEKSGAPNLDGNGVTVTRMSVKGFGCLDEAVLMSDAKGHLWAGVWVLPENASDPIELHYYTNVPGDKNTSKAIAAQRLCQDESAVRVRIMP